MKELITGVEIYQEIKNLDSEIDQLRGFLDTGVDMKSRVAFGLKFMDKPKSYKGDTYEQALNQVQGLQGFFAASCGHKIEHDFESILSEPEFLLVFGTLLKFKKEVRKNLVEKFNKLSISIKI